MGSIADPPDDLQSGLTRVHAPAHGFRKRGSDRLKLLCGDPGDQFRRMAREPGLGGEVAAIEPDDQGRAAGQAFRHEVGGDPTALGIGFPQLVDDAVEGLRVEVKGLNGTFDVSVCQGRRDPLDFDT